MNKNDLLHKINSIKNTKRIHRIKAAKFVIEYPETFPLLLKLVFNNNSNTSIKASWVFEFVCNDNLILLFPYISYFIDNLQSVSHESILRPISKVCFFIIKFYISGQPDDRFKKLSIENKNKIIEVNFDWLINNHKIATQVFAMDTLFYLGKELKWVHEELRLILEQNANEKSPGYQVRARRILKKLNN